RGRQVEPARQRSGAELESRRAPNPGWRRLAQLQTFGRALERPVQPCISQLPLLAGDEETRRMQNPDQLLLRKRGAARIRSRCRVTDFEVLVALRQDIEVKSI